MASMKRAVCFSTLSSRAWPEARSPARLRGLLFDVAERAIHAERICEPPHDREERVARQILREVLEILVRLLLRRRTAALGDSARDDRGQRY
jgi:hypothetical protein